MEKLRLSDVIALGFMTFALFVGAGNIIFPPIVGLLAGENITIAALGFLITAVGLPVITIIALARVEGSFDKLCRPLGKTAALLLAIICYISVGPLFATPRTTTVSFEIGFRHLFTDDQTSTALLIYSVLYFIIVSIVSLYPGKILDIVGRFLAPLKFLVLAIISISAIFWKAGTPMPATDIYQNAAFANGIINGYGTMDTLGALVFGIIIVNAIRSRGITDSKSLTRYSIYAGIMAGIGLVLLYACLFELGHSSASLFPDTINLNGAQILHVYVHSIFGSAGSWFLAIMILVACIVTAIGLTCACGAFFAKHFRYSYTKVVLVLCLFSTIVSNVGLTKLISISLPILSAIYPICILVILLSFVTSFMNKAKFVVSSTVISAIPFGIIDGLKTAGLDDYLPAEVTYLPLFDVNLSWLLPSITVFILAMLYDKSVNRKNIIPAS